MSTHVNFTDKSRNIKDKVDFWQVGTKTGFFIMPVRFSSMIWVSTTLPTGDLP